MLAIARAARSRPLWGSKLTVNFPVRTITEHKLDVAIQNTSSHSTEKGLVDTRGLGLLHAPHQKSPSELSSSSSNIVCDRSPFPFFSLSGSSHSAYSLLRSLPAEKRPLFPGDRDSAILFRLAARTEAAVLPVTSEEPPMPKTETSNFETR